GQITGIAATPTGTTDAFLWQGGVMHDLGAAYAASDINQSGQVVGAGPWPYGSSVATLWTPTTPNGTTGSFQSLGTIPHGQDGVDYYWVLVLEDSAAAGVNDLGTVVGTSHAYYEYPDPEVGGLYRSIGFIWSDGAMYPLGLH